MLRNIQNGFLQRDKCLQIVSKIPLPADRRTYCEFAHDGYLCWPPSKVGVSVKMHCPDIHGLDTTQYAYRKCGSDGNWSLFSSEIFTVDKTYYGECFIKRNDSTLTDVHKFRSDIFETAKINSILGLTLLAISVVAIIIALILYYFILPKFVNTILYIRIQKHLYASIGLDALTKFANQLIFLLEIQHGVEVSLPIVCKVLTTATHYLELALVAWIALDTHFLQVTSRSGHLCYTGYITYMTLGWALPVIPTTVWTVTLAVSHKVKCWNGHTTLAVKWIIQTPKLICLLLALIFLCMCVWRIFGNPRNRTMVDIRKIRYSIILTWIFYSLVTLSFVFTMVTTDAPIDLCLPCQYISTILISCRGLFLAIFYCFLSKDVHEYIHYQPTTTGIPKT